MEVNIGMDFVEEMRQFAVKIESIRNHIHTEEATKTSLILPFIKLLGYDIFNPAEVVPEFTVDIGTKKGEKVDYCIKINGQPQILVEAKNHDDPLLSYDAQLFRYFSATSAKFAILTNGIQYKFYTDLKEPNKLDETPFFEFDLFNIKEGAIIELKKFQKHTFNAEQLFSTASNLKYMRRVKEIFGSQFKDPNEDFIRFFLKDIYTGKVTQRILEDFKPLIKNALTQYINDQLNDALQKAIASTQETTKEVAAQEENQINEVKKQIETTIDELEGFHAVKYLIGEVVDIKRIGYRDTRSYLGIYIDGPHSWFCRLYFNGPQKSIGIVGENKKETRYNISSIEDIVNYRSQLIDAAKHYLQQ